MPDEDANKAADAETVPKTSLHAYGEGREEDVEGDVEKLKSSDPETSQVKEIEDEGGDPDDVIDPPRKV